MIRKPVSHPVIVFDFERKLVSVAGGGQSSLDKRVADAIVAQRKLAAAATPKS